MTTAEAKRLIQDGLQLRKQRRAEAEEEARMEEYEKDMISFCNGNCASAKETRMKEDQMHQTLILEATRQKEQREKMAAIRRQEREQLQREMERDATVYDTVRGFVIFCLAVALVTVWTPFPWWAAVALVIGSTAFTAAYIFRVYFPVT